MLHVPCYLSKPSVFLFLFLIGLFGMGEKSWGANCGDEYAGTRGACMGFVTCPDGYWQWSYFSAVTTCSTTESCCVQNTTCGNDWTECIIKGSKGACENGVCIAGKEPVEPPAECSEEEDGQWCTLENKDGTCMNGNCVTEAGSNIGDFCGSTGGTCQMTNGSCTTKSQSSGRNCSSDLVCCEKTAQEATKCPSESAEGATCESSTGTPGKCEDGYCRTDNGVSGSSCGTSESSICVKSGECKSPSSLDWVTGRSCVSGYECCKIKTTTSPTPITESSCGTNGGTCKDMCNDTAGEKEDSASPQCTNSQKCCYTAYKADDGTTPKDFEYKNPLNANTFTEWAETVLTSVQSIVGWLAVIMLMIGGIVYLTSAGTNQATLGKDIITAALIGFAVVIAGPSLLKEIKDIASTSGSSSSSAIDSAKDIKSIITSVLEFLLASMGTLALIGFAVGGVFYLTAFGDKGKAETGKKMAINSLYAIALAGGGLILVNQILSLLGS